MKNIREYEQIQICTGREFIDSDVDHKEVLTDYQVNVVDDENGAVVVCNNQDYGILFLIYCTEMSELLEVLSLGDGDCTPTFSPGYSDFVNDTLLNETMNEVERDVWFHYFTCFTKE